MVPQQDGATLSVCVAHPSRLIATALADAIAGEDVTAVPVTSLDDVDRTADVFVCHVWLLGDDPARVVQAAAAAGQRCVVLSPRDEDLRFLYGAVSAGHADGFVPESSSTDELRDAVDKVADRQLYFPRHLTAVLVDYMRSVGPNADIEALLARELELLRALCEDTSNVEAYQRAGLTPAAGKAVTRELYRKLGVTSRAAAVAVGFTRRLLP